MKARSLSIIFFVLISGVTSLYGQTVEWAKAFGGSSSDEGSSITVDASGNVYTTGWFKGTVDFDPGAGTANLTSAGNADVFVQKLDASGNFLWAKSFGGSSFDGGSSITVDASGNVYATGEFDGTVDFDPGTGVSFLTSAGFKDAFVQKLDANGNFLWAKSFGGSNTLVNSSSIAIDNSGGIYTTGFFRDMVDFDPGVGVYTLTSNGYNDVFIQKLDASGNFLWANSFGGTSYNDQAISIATDPFGNVYTTGSFRGYVDFDPGLGTYFLISYGFPTGCCGDIFVHKVDANGNFLWAKSFRGPAGSSNWALFNVGNSLAIDASGYVYTTGQFNGTVDFNPDSGVYNLSSAGLDDVFIQKMDWDGNFIWARSRGGSLSDYGNDIAVDGIGNVYTIGEFFGSDTSIYKLDANGNYLWPAPFVENGGGIGKSIAIDTLNNVYTSGSFEGVMKFGSGSGGGDSLVSNGFADVFVVKYPNAIDFDTISGVAVDAKYESQTQTLAYPPLTNVLVKLLDDQDILLDSTFSDPDGAFSFDSISSEADHVIAMYVSPAGDTFEVTHAVAGSNGQMDFVIPVSIANSVSILIPGLEHFSFTISAIGETVTIDGYDLQTLEALLLDAQYLEGDGMVQAQTLGRMLILEFALDRYFTNANLLLEERQLAIRDFSLFFASMLNVYQGLALLPNTTPFQKLVANHLLGLLGQSIQYLSQLTLSILPGENGQATRADIQEAINYITLIAVEGDYAEGVVQAASEEYIIRRPMKNKIQEKYLEITQVPLDNTLLQSLSYPVTDGFDVAYQIMESRTATAQNRMVNGVQVSTFTRGVGNMESKGYELLGFAGDLAAIISQNGTLGNLANVISKYSKVITITRAVGLLSALAATDAYFKINRNDVFADIEDVLSWQIPPTPGTGFPVMLDDIEANLDSCVSAYITILRQIETDIQSGQYAKAESEIIALLSVDSCVSSILASRIAPIMATNEVLSDSVAGYKDLFMSEMAAPIMEADFLRFQALSLCLAFSLDTLKSTYADSIRLITDTLETKWAIATPKIDSAYSIASQFSSPAYILVLEADFPDTLAPGATTLVKLVFQNVGNTDAEQVLASILAREGLVVDPPQIFVGNLAAGEKGSITIEIEAPFSDVLAGYQVLFSAENASAAGIGGAIIVGSPDISAGLSNRISTSPLTIIPNPFSEQAVIQFESQQTGTWKLSLFSLNGQILRQQEINLSTPGMQEVMLSGKGLSYGMYLVVLQAPDGELLRGKLSFTP